MKCVHAACLALTITIAPSSTWAAGYTYLSWDDCVTDGYASTKQFSCDTNEGSHALVGAYMLTGAPADSINGNEIRIEIWTSGFVVQDPPPSYPDVPSWWQLKNFADGTPACRQGSTSISFDFSSFTACHDYWMGRALGGFGLIHPTALPSRMTLLAVAAVPPAQAGPLDANVPTYSFRLVISNAKTTGPASCGGCAQQVFLYIPQILVTQNDGVPTREGDSNTLRCDALGSYAVWSPAATPTRSASWGAIKSLYR